MATPRKGKGATFSRGGSSIASVASITPGELASDTSETTHLGSTAKTHLGIGLPDGGEYQIVLVFDPQETAHQTLVSDVKAGTESTFRLTFSDASYAEFAGVPTKFQVQEITPTNHLVANCTIKVSGAVTVSP